MVISCILLVAIYHVSDRGRGKRMSVEVEV